MSIRISLTLEASEMFLSLHTCMIFSLERAAVVWAVMESISGFDPSLEMIAISRASACSRCGMGGLYIFLFIFPF